MYAALAANNQNLGAERPASPGLPRLA